MEISIPRLGVLAVLLLLTTFVQQNERLAFENLPVALHNLTQNAKACDGNTAMMRLG